MSSFISTTNHYSLRRVNSAPILSIPSSSSNKFNQSIGTTLARHLTTCLNHGSYLLLLSIGYRTGLLSILSTNTHKFLTMNQLLTLSSFSHFTPVIQEWIHALIVCEFLECKYDYNGILKVRMKQSFLTEQAHILSAGRLLLRSCSNMMNGNIQDERYGGDEAEIMIRASQQAIDIKLKDDMWGVMIGAGAWKAIFQLEQENNGWWVVYDDTVKKEEKTRERIGLRNGELVETGMYEMAIVGATEEIENIAEKVCGCLREGGKLIWTVVQDGDGAGLWASAIQVLDGFGGKGSKWRFWKAQIVKEILEKNGLVNVKVNEGSEVYCVVMGEKRSESS